MKIIDGKKLAEKIKDKIAQEIFELKGPRPNLAILLVGEREDSKIYVNTKEREAKKIGIDTHIYRCPADIKEEEIIQTINFLNNDKTIDAILIQLPLPTGFNTDKIISTIDPNKDVDCFHPDNQKLLSQADCENKILPPVLKVVLAMLESIDCDLKNKKIGLVVNSDIFGNSLAKVLTLRGADVEIIKSNDPEIKNKSSKADILITAMGKPKFIKKDFIKKEAIVIDIGIAKENEQIFGDVDFEEADGQAGFISPVPGGVGPMTIAMLFKNTLELFKRKK